MRLRKSFWIALMLLTVIALILTSCQQNPGQQTTSTTVNNTTTTTTSIQTSTTTPTSTSTPVTTTTTAPVVGPSTAAPKYGGTVTMAWSTDVTAFDDAFTLASSTIAGLLAEEQIWEGDWAKGPAGTSEVSWAISGFQGIQNYSTGRVGESWEVTGASSDTLVIHVRKGIHFHQKPPTNGRELTASDVAYSINRIFTTPTAFLYFASVHPVSVNATDQWTVEVKYKSAADLYSVIVEVCNFLLIWPEDALLANNNDMRDWRVNIGSGPFMLTDYVKSSSLTFTKNDNYWGKDPVGPGKGNQLPYVDGVKILIIRDISTQQAAIRTGKTDQGAFSWDIAASLKKTNPELQSSKNVGVSSSTGYFIKLRMDDPAFPWSDIRVRQALHMAVDYQSIVDNYYGGNAVVYSWPAAALPESSKIFVPMDQLPPNVQDLFKYQPEKAKQLLSDAGYANGFTLEVVCQPQDVDLLSIYKDYFAKIGVDLILDVKEPGVYNGVWANRTAKNAIFAYSTTNVPFYLQDFIGDVSHNLYVNDAHIAEARDRIRAAFADFDTQAQIFKEITPYILEQAYLIPSPAYYTFNMWQPWVKNYHGELYVGNVGRFLWSKWIWIDQNVKSQ